MLTVTAPAAVDGGALAAELRAAGLTVDDLGVVLAGDQLEVHGATEKDRATVERVAAAHVPPPAPEPVPTLAELAAEVRGMKRAAAAEAAKSTTTAKGVAAAIAADSR